MALDPTACGSNLTLEELLNSLLGKSANGAPYVRVVQVAETGDDYFSCGSADRVLNPAELFEADSNGNLALRVHIDGI